jgi:hypothetical protein
VRSRYVVTVGVFLSIALASSLAFKIQRHPASNNRANISSLSDVPFTCPPKVTSCPTDNRELPQ